MHKHIWLKQAERINLRRKKTGEPFFCKLAVGNNIIESINRKEKIENSDRDDQ